MRPEVAKAVRIAESAIKGFPGGVATDAMIECIDEYVQPGVRTIETGCGHTTGAFIGAGAHHFFFESNIPKLQSLERAFREFRPLPVGHAGDSADRLLEYWSCYSRQWAGFALMDGCDNDITTVSDAIFLFRMLKPGGYLLVDDVSQPWVARAIGVLTEARMKVVKEVGGRSRLFRKAE